RAERTRMHRARLVNTVGLALTVIVLAVVLTTRFTRGAWLAVVMVGVLVLVMVAVNRHYAGLAAQLAAPGAGMQRALPSRVHAVVLISRVQQPVLRALAYARATRPATLSAVTVAVDRDQAEAVRRAWDEADLPVPLTVLDSPYRELSRPVLEHVQALRRG